MPRFLKLCLRRFCSFTVFLHIWQVAGCISLGLLMAIQETAEPSSYFLKVTGLENNGLSMMLLLTWIVVSISSNDGCKYLNPSKNSPWGILIDVVGRPLLSASLAVIPLSIWKYGLTSLWGILIVYIVLGLPTASLIVCNCLKQWRPSTH